MTKFQFQSSATFDGKKNMRRAIVTRNAFNKSQNQINIQCGVLEVREAKRVQSLFSKEFLALVVNACIAKAGKKSKVLFGLGKIPITLE